MTQPRERLEYSAIVDRPALKLPGDARMAIWSVINLEVWDITRPMARQLLPAPNGRTVLPDVPHWSWHEYGMRVGFWRLHDLYQRRGIEPTVSINARVCADYTRVAAACRDAGWEFMAHSYEQQPLHAEPHPQATIARTLQTIERFTGRRPKGWLGPGLTETLETPDHLAAAGIRYIGDWVHDDEPTEIATAYGPLVTLPYSIECNDITMFVVQHHEPRYWTQKCIDTFDQLYEESAARPKFMTIAVHPYISGQPARLRYLDEIYAYISRFDGVRHWNGEQALAWHESTRVNA
ncbi:MAG: polysaccharide deacetylase family protein [Vicinamibacterales bacterium]